MRVLVTGAAGFIGRHVCEALDEAGHHVLGLDQGGVLPRSCREWMAADITKGLAPIPMLDAVIHLAAIAAPRECDRNPTLAFDVNVNGTLQVLKMALESGAKKVVFSSSAHVYDIPPRYLPTDETHPLRLNNTYTTTKLLGEQLCHLYWENHGLPYTTLRLYNAYGPGQALGYFIPDQVAKAKQGPLSLSGGNTTKDWVHIADVARAFVLALDSHYVGAINIGTGIETELSTIAAKIAELQGVGFVSGDDPRATRMCANRMRAERILGWKPSISLMEGLRGLLDPAKSPAFR